MYRKSLLSYSHRQFIAELLDETSKLLGASLKEKNTFITTFSPYFHFLQALWGIHIVYEYETQIRLQFDKVMSKLQSLKSSLEFKQVLKNPKVCLDLLWTGLELNGKCRRTYFLFLLRFYTCSLLSCSGNRKCWSTQKRKSTLKYWI